MRVKILTEGGENIGLGHISRCVSLYDEIVSRGINVEIIVFGDCCNVNFLEGVNVINEDWQNEKYLIENIENDIYVIIDSYLLEENLYTLISSRAKKMLCIDDYNRLEYKNCVVVNPSLYTDDLEYKLYSDVNYLLGKDYIILRNPFRIKNRKQINVIAKNVLVIMGGSDVKNVTPRIIEEVCNFYEDVNFEIVIGSTFKYKENLISIAQNNVKFHFNLHTEEIKDLMLNSDIAITAAGQTIYELIVTNTPFISIKVVDNQSNNLKGLKKYIENYNYIDIDELNWIESLKKEFNNFLEKKTRTHFCEEYTNLIDGKGVERIINQLLSNSNQFVCFRKALLNDCELIYEWANDYFVRTNAFNTEKIDYETHKKWFYDKINNVNSIIYIVLTNENPIGQIRIDIENEYGIIDYSISSEYRGKGYGTIILKEIHIQIKNENLNIKKLIGKVKIDNFSSQKAFEKAGFSRIEQNEFVEYYLDLKKF